MNKKILSLMVASAFILGACSTENTSSANDDKSTKFAEEILAETDETETYEIEEEAKTEYGLDEWWEVEGQWKVKIDSVWFTDERNQFSDKSPEAVAVIKYSYENLGYESDIQDLYITPDTVIDGEKKVAERYPAGSNVSAKPTPVGAMTEGAEESYGLTSDQGEIAIHFEKYDNDRKKEKAIFIIKLPSE